MKYLQASRKYVFDFTGKKVKCATGVNKLNKLNAQTKFDLAWFIDRINPDLCMEICEGVYKYDELKQMLLKLLTEKEYENVLIYK